VPKHIAADRTVHYSPLNCMSYIGTEE